jgi:hypothetical protein
VVAWSPELSLEEIADRLTSVLGFRRVSEPGESPLRMRGGSQFRSALRGGHLDDLKQLPCRVQVARHEAGRLQIEVEDALGVAVRDDDIRARYADLVDRIAAVASPI